jgi:hypothetical protein
MAPCTHRLFTGIQIDWRKKGIMATDKSTHIIKGEQLTTQYSVQIIWGSEEHRRETQEDNDGEPDIHEYRFATEVELKAFLQGCDEANGYMDYLVVGDEEVEGEALPADVSLHVAGK